MSKHQQVEEWANRQKEQHGIYHQQESKYD
jgi:hypothetical protein